MTTQEVTLKLPDVLYQTLKTRAEQTHRSVEAEMLDVLATSVPIANQLPADLEEELASLALLDDNALWRAARSTFSPDAARQLGQLHHKQQREGLTEAETQITASLVRQYERAMLVRAQAAALLKQHGHDISGLLTAR